MIDDIIMKDIAAAHAIQHVGILRDFFLLCMERAGKAVSINKLANILGISPDTSRRYSGYFLETYLIHPISRHGKTNERIRSPKQRDQV
jgi:predicted AAA+ superfamily ATPase